MIWKFPVSHIHTKFEMSILCSLSPFKCLEIYKDIEIWISCDVESHDKKSSSATEISYEDDCSGITGECAGNLVCDTEDTDTCLCSNETNEYHKGDNVCETSKYCYLFSVLIWQVTIYITETVFLNMSIPPS